MRAILDAARGHDAITLAATSKERPWSVSGFDTEWQRPRTRLEAEGEIGPGLTLHGLRHSVAHVVAEQGFSLRTIADALVHSSENMARHYSRDGDLTKKMGKVGKVFDLGAARARTKLSTLGENTVNPSGGRNQ
ncbi:MAG: tyrosine-type recombinase/integrase [Pseudomonadota bacterium]|nr:tyrosine-type recombinase/integrase [Pseudomonadota bacterium]